MRSSSDYLRVLDGRIHIKLRELKESPAVAEKLEQSLLRMSGITYIEANPLTGSILVLFESGVISGQEVLRRIREFGEVHNTKAFWRIQA
jgi:Heavy metal associated domain 2